MSCFDYRHLSEIEKKRIEKFEMFKFWFLNFNILQVVYALACGKYIVTPKFFEDLLDCCDQKIGKKLPDEKKYLHLNDFFRNVLYPNQI